MTTPGAIVLLLNMDNTLLENDRLVADLGEHLAQEFGDKNRDRYWEIFEALRAEQGYTDYLGTPVPAYLKPLCVVTHGQ